MRIVNTCNFDGDYPDESFLAVPNMTEDRAKQLVDLMNKSMGENHARYWKVVPNDYVLLPGFEP